MDFVSNFIPGEVEHDGSDDLVRLLDDPGMNRPYLDSQGRPSVTINTGRRETRKGPDGQPICNVDGTPRQFSVYEQRLIRDFMNRGIFRPVWNATTLRYREWVEIDRIVLKATRDRLRAWADLAAANTYGGFDGFSKMMLEHERMTDSGIANVDMDGLGQGQADHPLFQLEGVPLPITHSDFWFSERKLAVSRAGNTPLDIAMGEMAARRVAETVEKTTIGTLAGVTYGDSTNYGNTAKVYGYATHPDRITKTDVTAPTAGGWTPATLLGEVLTMVQLANAQKFYGPFMLYYSTDWSPYMNNDYYVSDTSVVARTLADRLRQIADIQDVRRLDLLTSTFTLLLVQMTADVCRAIIGMNVNTVQWQEQGGSKLCFKVRCIMVPDVRSVYVGSTTTAQAGIVHGTTS